ncbi:MAG: FtsQ-type POTRA domain-containing protein [Treponema sp.]|nr:FtsQ-type POTRA domain-containing protein [Treponema sp.]
MSADYLLEEELLSGVPSRLEKILKRIILAAAVILAAELVWLFGITPFMPLSKIEINGHIPLAQEAILARAGIGPQTSFMSLDTAGAERALGDVPLIDSAGVHKYFPGRVVINLEARKAAALSLGTLGGETVPVIFDKKGKVFQIGFYNGLAGPELPLISGLVFDEPRLGMQVPALFRAFLEDLDEIEHSAPELLGALSEIRIIRKSFDGFELMLYPVSSRIRVRLGPEINEDLLRYTLLVVDVLSARNPEAGTVDFRAGMASYTIKEASFEQ